MDAERIVAACLVTLAVAHSVLGEAQILRPLFGSSWSIGPPRWVTERILRFAWHLTSIAWLALAAIVVDADPLPVVAIMSLWSATVIFVMLRGHLAWPLFLLAGLAALHADGLLDSSLKRGGAITTSALLLAAAGLHVYWAFGGRWMLDRTLPVSPNSSSGFSPGRALTLLVAGALASFAGLIVSVLEGLGPESLRWLVGIGIGVLALRAIGDTKAVGFTKSVRNTAFAQADDRLFTPLVVFLALGATGALVM